MNFFKGLIKFAIVVIIFCGGLFYVLTPTNSIKNNETLAKSTTNFSFTDLNGDIINNINYSGNKMTTKIVLDNETFIGFLKAATQGNADIQSGSYKLAGNKVSLRYPVQLGPVDSNLDAEASVSTENNNLILTIDSAKLGKIPIPDFAVETVLKNQISTSTTAKVSGTSIVIPLSNEFSIENADVVNSELNITLGLTNQQLLRLGGTALRTALGG